jgi:CRP-like cAMP-binding protein
MDPRCWRTRPGGACWPEELRNLSDLAQRDAKVSFDGQQCDHDVVILRFVPFFPGYRPTGEHAALGFGCSDCAAMVTGNGRSSNRAVLLFEVAGLADDAVVDASITIDGRALPGWDRRRVPLSAQVLQRIELLPDRDLAGEDLGFTAGFLRRARVELRVTQGGSVVACDQAWLDVCEVRALGTLYRRIMDLVVAPDAARQAIAAGVPDPALRYHPWYPVLTIGADKAALYTSALVADIVGKEHHLTDPAWLLRVGVHLELLTCLGIIDAVREDIGDILDAGERAAYENCDAFAEVRARVRPDAWRDVWRMRQIAFARRGSPRTGPVSVLNLMRKRDATLRFLHVHHEDLKNAIELAGPNPVNAQETWQRVFRDAERAVTRQTGQAFPELAFLPAPVREVVLWQRLGFAGQQGIYPTACSQYRASMNSVADWAKARGLMDYAGDECVPAQVSLIDAYTRDRSQVAVLQRHDGLGPRLDIYEPIVSVAPSIDEIEALLAEAPILRALPGEGLHRLAISARPLLLGPTERFVIEGQPGTSMFLVGEGEVEVRLRREDGHDWLADTMGRGEIVGEMALITGGPRTATVRSVGETVIYEIGRQQYEPLLREYPEWLDDLTVVMHERIARRATADPARRSHSLRQRIVRALSR